MLFRLIESDDDVDDHGRVVGSKDVKLSFFLDINLLEIAKFRIISSYSTKLALFSQTTKMQFI